MFSLSVTLVVCSLLYFYNTQAEFNEKSASERVKPGTLNPTDAMVQCNRTFLIKPEYLQELNDTGSFPDESEKTPMCFTKCYLEATGIMGNDSKVNKEKALALYNLDNDDVVDDCSSEVASAAVTDDCEKAYFFARCIMTRALLDNLNEDNDNAN